jgi:predicted CXXCH cytochrome family protein
MKIKKTLRIVFLCSLMLLFAFAHAQARITNNTCSNCHTMHNSQNATWMQLGDTSHQFGFGKGDCEDCHSTTRAVLLRLDCIGCHAKELNTNNNITSDGWPQVALNMGPPEVPTPITFLAGGNYKYVFQDDSYGHNVHGFGSAIGTDTDLGNNPPGYDSNYDPSTSGGYDPGVGTGQILCAGQNGCHGNRDTSVPYISMKATHHANDSMLKFGTISEGQQGGGAGGADTTAAGKSYRFLYNVHGGEDSDWQASVSATDHNEYKGATFASRPIGTPRTWANIDTISDLCAECHGYFHASDEITDQTPPTGTPWKRHPTDAVIPASGEYASYTAYSTEAPAARASIPIASPSGSVNPGTNNAIVMCLSCHRAHASEFPDILRWDYSTMIAGGGGSGGCFTCHTTKDTSP